MALGGGIGGFFEAVKQGALGGGVRYVVDTPSGQAAVKDELNRRAFELGRWLPWLFAGAAIAVGVFFAFRRK